MKKRRLRTWVKVAIMLFAIECLLIANDTIYKTAVNGCVQAGYTEEFCMNSLK